MKHSHPLPSGVLYGRVTWSALHQAFVRRVDHRLRNDGLQVELITPRAGGQ